MRKAPAILVVLIVLALVGPSLTPRPPDLQEDVAGARLLPPLTRASAVQLGPDRLLIVTDLKRTSDGGWEAIHAGSPIRIEAPEVTPRTYLLGTDDLGRDLASRILHALRHTLVMATIAVAIALVLGFAIGSLSGLAGGWRDALLMRGVDVVLSVPRLLLFLLLAALFRPSALLLLVVLGGTTWPGLARLVRAEVVARKRSDLTAAARASGCSPLRTALVHLLPQVAPVLVVTAALRFADTVLLESSASFLGLGAPPPAVSLGNIIASGRDDLAHGWWVAAFPIVVLVILVATVRATAAGWFSREEVSSVE